jgi:hypothetical protein
MTGLDWLDSHAGSATALATVVLVAVTVYYAWWSRRLVRETHLTLQAAARATLQTRLDRISEICIREPGLFERLDEESATGAEMDQRFHLTSMFLGLLEEAFIQHSLEHSMTEDDWMAWQATSDTFLARKYVQAYWKRVHGTFEPSFTRFVDARLAACEAKAEAGVS